METNVIHQGDCVEIMRRLISDNSIHLTVTSPPYDLVDYDSDGNLVTIPGKGLRDYQGYTWDFAATARELWRVTAKGGVVVWVAGDATVKESETGSSFRQALGFMEVGFRLHDTMIWQKFGSPFPDENRYYQVFEYMFVLSKKKLRAANLIEQIATGHGGGVLGSRNSKGIFEPMKYTRGHKTRAKDNVWQIANHGKNNKDDLSKEHPARFPEALARDHILSWSNPGDLILDPFAGSGTVPKMATLTDRRYIGIEISAEYCDLARERVIAAEGQPKLIPFEGNSVTHKQAAFDFNSETEL